MGEHQTRAKSRRHGDRSVQRTVAGPGYSMAPTRSPLGALYSAAPAFGLGAPIQTKVEIGQAHDAYEREADTVAGHVLAGRQAPPISSLAAGGLGGVTQREEKKPEEKKEPVQRQAAEEEKEPVQTYSVQLEEQQPEEKKEPVQRQGMDEEKEPIQTWRVQRAEDNEEEQPVQTQRNRANAAGHSATMADTAAHAIRNRGAGESLHPATRQALEGSMGADLSRVRVHQDSAADEATRGLKARAFTNQNHIWLRPGESQNDLRLMAHEATHVVQQRAAPSTTLSQPVMRLSEDDSRVQRQPATAWAKPTPATPGTAPVPKAGEEVAPSEVQIKGQAKFNPAEPIASWLEKRPKQTGLVNVRFGSIGYGPVKVRQRTKSKAGEKWYEIRREDIPITHPLFTQTGEASSALQPHLILSSNEEALTGYITLGTSKSGPRGLASKLMETPGLIGLTGFDMSKLPTVENKLDAGKLNVGLNGIPIHFGSILNGTFTIIADDERVTTFSGKLSANVRGLVTGAMDLTRSAEGKVTGEVELGVQLPKNFSGGVKVAWDGEKASGEGKVGYQGEKLSGNVILKIMPQSQAAQLESERKTPSESGEGPTKAGTVPAKAAAKTPKKNEPYAVFGEGDLTFAFTDWLNGTAHVIVDPKGHVTIIGKITPQKEFELFPQKDYNKDLFKVEARASYGIPVVGNIFIFANVGMSAFAKLGPAKFYNIVIQGTYSTDPAKSKNFSIQGSLNISAAAGLKLRGEAGAGLEILGHDIKAGAGINGIAGIKGYAEATPIIGYREKATGGEDKKGEFYIRGELEIAAQPFLGLSGDLFVEVDSPWWSPLPDKKWTWPLFGKEWPIGGSLGVGATVDYVFGSGQAPSLEFKPVNFSAEKFMTDLYNDKAPAKSGKGEEKKPGAWKEKNSKAAEPPPKESRPGGAPVGKAPELPPAKSKVQPGGPKKATKPVDPSARTAEGKSVKDLKDEASKKGKKGVPTPKGAKGEASNKTKDPQKRHDDELQKGLAALDAVTARYAKDGATKEELISGVKAVRRKFKVFKSINVVDGGDTWYFDYVASPGTKRKSARNRTKTGKSELKINDVVLGWAPRRSGSTSFTFIPGVVTKIDDKKQRFHWKSVNLAIERTAILNFTDEGKKWKRGHISQKRFSKEKMEEENKKQKWSDIDTARKVLNYRYHNEETNPSGMQWEHIIEQSAGGAHSSGNLALTSSVINNKLGKLFGQPYASHEVPRYLSGTDGKPLREFLKGKSLYIQNLWKKYFYEELGVSLRWKRSARGLWRELS